jgi:hypothetical protein
MQGYQPAARRLAQLPDNPQQLADGGAVGFGARGLAGLRQMIPLVRAMGYPQQQAAAPAPAADTRTAQLQAMIPRMEAMGYKQQPQYLARGGLVRGPGTGTSDSIPDEAEPGTFIMPADSTAEIGPSALEKLGTVPVRLSDGEFKLPPEQVMAIGEAVLKLMKDATHAPVNGVDGGQTDAEVAGARGFEPGAAKRMAEVPEQVFADGGTVGFQRMDIGRWAQDQEQGREELARFEARQAVARQEQADADEYARQQAEEAKRRAAQPDAADPPAGMFADGGLIENNVTRVGNSYSGGNVGGAITVNGAAPAGTFSENPGGRVATAPAPAPDPTTVSVIRATPPAAAPVAATSTTAPATAAASPAPSAPMGWAERNAQRNAEVSAASITNRPEWSKTAMPRTAGFGAPPPVPSVPPPAPVPSLSSFGYQPRRYADGGTVEDRAVFGFYPQLADHGKTTRATQDKLQQGVQATGPSAFQPAAPAAEPRPLPAATRLNSLTDPRSLAFAGTVAPAAAPAPAEAAPTGALSRAAQLGAPSPAPLPQGPVSAQNMGAAESLSRRGAAEAMANMPNAPKEIQAPVVRHSGNDWQARNDLRNALVSASSITNNGGKWDRHKGESAEALTYRAMLGTDQALRNSVPGLDQAAMRENAENQRTGMQVAASSANSAADRMGAMDRTLVTERGNNTRAGIQADATIEAARTKADAASNKPLNDVQSKALQFGTRMRAAGAVLDGLAARGVDQPGLIKRAADTVGLGTAANWTQSGEQQQVEQAQRDFINAVLRRESGAAIAESEFANARQQYFPQIGDSPEVIAQKRKNREIAAAGVLAEVPDAETRIGQVMNAANANAGPPLPGQPQRVDSQQAFAALPSGARFVAPDGSVRVKP